MPSFLMYNGIYIIVIGSMNIPFANLFGVAVIIIKTESIQ